MRACAVVVALLTTGCSFRPGGDGGEDAAGDDDGDADVVVDAADGDAVDVDAADIDAAAVDARAIDARVIDARVIDARAIDAAGPILLETINVPAIGTVMTSQTTLEVGVQYTLRVTGEVVIAANGAQADADYWNYNVGNAPEDLAGGTVDIGVGINDTTVDVVTLPDWGPYTATHVYQAMFTGVGQTITAKFHDGNPGNNTGSLVLQIYGP